MAIEHVIDFQDALTGELLGPADVATLSPEARVESASLPAQNAETAPDGAALRRIWAMPTAGNTYVLRVEGADSRLRAIGTE